MQAPGPVVLHAIGELVPKRNVGIRTRGRVQPRPRRQKDRWPGEPSVADSAGGGFVSWMLCFSGLGGDLCGLDCRASQRMSERQAGGAEHA